MWKSLIERIGAEIADREIVREKNSSPFARAYAQSRLLSIGAESLVERLNSKWKSPADEISDHVKEVRSRARRLFWLAKSIDWAPDALDAEIARSQRAVNQAIYGANSLAGDDRIVLLKIERRLARLRVDLA